MARPAAAPPPSGFTAQSGLVMPELAAGMATPAAMSHLAPCLD